MRLRTTSAIFGAIALGLAAGGAQALPAPKALDTGVSGSAVEQVDWRYYRHCHGGWRYRHCHGGHAYYRPYYSYGYRPYYRSYGYRRSWW